MGQGLVKETGGGGGGGGLVQVGDNTVYSLKEGSLRSRRVLCCSKTA